MGLLMMKQIVGMVILVQIQKKSVKNQLKINF